MLKIGDAKAKLILCFVILIAVGLIAEAQPLTNLSKCSELSKSNCLSNPNCELKKVRKKKSTCVDRPQLQAEITFRIDIVPSKTNLTANEAVSVFWNNSGTAWANDFIAFVPKGAQWGSKFSYFYVRALLSGNSTLNAPSTPGYYELVYYGSNGLKEAARSTAIEVKASYEATAVSSATATCKDNSSFVTVLWQMSNWPFVEGPKGTEVIIENGPIFSNQLDSGLVTWGGAQHNKNYNYRVEWLRSRLPNIVGISRNGSFTTLDCSLTQSFSSPVVSTIDLKCQQCFWEMAFTGHPNNQNELAFISQLDNFLRFSHDGGKTWSSKYLRGISMDFFGDPKFVSSGDGYAYLAGDVFLKETPEFPHNVGGGLYKIKFADESIRTTFVKNTPRINEVQGSIFDYPKIARDPNTGAIFVVALSRNEIGKGLDNSLFISNNDGTNFTEIPLDTLFRSMSIDVDINGNAFIVNPVSDNFADIAIPYKIRIIKFERTSGKQTNISTPFEYLFTWARVSSVSGKTWQQYQGPLLFIDKGSRSPRNGRMYLLWAAPKSIVNDPKIEFYGMYGHDFDVIFAYSDDQGATWSKKLVNDDTTSANQFFPAMSLDEDGGIHIVFADKRENPDGEYMDFYYAYSSDGGNTFTKNIRVNNEHIINKFGGRSIGDYLDNVVGYKNVSYVAYPCGVSHYDNGTPYSTCIATIDLSKRSFCTDSDDGLNYYVKGFMKFGQDSGHQDGCSNNNGLVEYYCDGAEGKKLLYNCPNGCKDGACIYDTSVSKVFQKAVKVAVIMVKFNDQQIPTTFDHQSVYQAMFNGSNSVKNYYETVSYGKLSFSGDVLGWYNLPSAARGCDIDKWGEQAKEAARAAGVDISMYTDFAFVIPHSYAICDGLGGVDLPGKNFPFAFVTLQPSVNTLIHEIGHSMGLGHANSFSCGAKAIDNYSRCIELEYNDPTDAMGGMGGPALPWEFNAPHRIALGLLPDANVVTVDKSGTYDVYALEISTTQPQVLRIRKADTNEYYYISYRRPVGAFDQRLSESLTSGAMIHIWDGNSWTPTKLIDTKPENCNPSPTNPDCPASLFTNAALTDGAMFEDITNGITITQIQHGDSSVRVKVNFISSVACSSLSTTECLSYPNCELKRSRKNRQRCADKI